RQGSRERTGIASPPGCRRAAWGFPHHLGPFMAAVLFGGPAAAPQHRDTAGSSPAHLALAGGRSAETPNLRTPRSVAAAHTGFGGQRWRHHRGRVRENTVHDLFG